MVNIIFKTDLIMLALWVGIFILPIFIIYLLLVMVNRKLITRHSQRGYIIRKNIAGNNNSENFYNNNPNAHPH